MHKTFNSHDIAKKAKELTAIAEPPVVCQVCGKVLQHRSDGINFWFNVGIGVPGTPHLAAFGCDSGEHWACSIPCLKKLGPACFEEHVIPTIEEGHRLLIQTKENYEKSLNQLIEEKNNGNGDNNVLGKIPRSG